MIASPKRMMVFALLATEDSRWLLPRRLEQPCGALMRGEGPTGRPRSAQKWPSVQEAKDQTHSRSSRHERGAVLHDALRGQVWTRHRQGYEIVGVGHHRRTRPCNDQRQQIAPGAAEIQTLEGNARDRAALVREPATALEPGGQCRWNCSSRKTARKARTSSSATAWKLSVLTS